MDFSLVKKIWLRTDRLVCFVLLAAAAVPATARTPLDALARLNRLGADAYLAGQFAEAEGLYKEALSEGEGADGHHRAVVWSNLAAVYKRQQRFDEAAGALEHVVEFRRAALGESHPLVAVALNNLGELRRIQGQTSAAAKLFERSAALLSNSDSVDRAAVLNNLGAIRIEQGRYTEARRVLDTALALKESLLGAKHPQVAVTLNNIANVLQETGDSSGAERVHLRALSIWETDPTSPADAAVTLTNLGRLHTAQKRWDDAERMHRRALVTLERAGLSETRFAAAVWHNLALLHQRRKRHPEADEAFDRALSIRVAVLGEHHPLVTQLLHDRGLVNIGPRRHTVDVLELRSSR